MSTTSAAVGDAFGIAGIVNAGTARGPRIDAVTGGCYAVVDFVWLPDAIRAMARALKRCPLWTPGQMEARRTELELTIEPGVVMTDRLATQGLALELGLPRLSESTLIGWPFRCVVNGTARRGRQRL